MLKLINRCYKIFWLKSTITFKQQTRISLKLVIEKVRCHPMIKESEQFLQVSVHTDEKSTENTRFEQNNKNQFFCDKNSFGSKCKRFRKSAIRKNFKLKRETQKKNTHSNNRDDYIYKYNEVKEKL